MENKEHENMFKFGLYQGNETINESTFTADVYNPVVRYSVDIRDDIYSIILRLQKALSKRDLTHTVEYGDKGYDFINYYRDQISLETQEFNDKLKLKKKSRQTVKGKTYSGVQFKFGLYINGLDNKFKPIVERDFYVEGYNPAARFSLELSETVSEIAQEIDSDLKYRDINHMWDDYDLIYTYGLHINQIREISNGYRKKMMANINDGDFVKNAKRGFRS